MITGYGMTETAGYVTALDWRDPPAVRATGSGTPLPGVELRIVDADGDGLRRRRSRARCACAAPGCSAATTNKPPAPGSMPKGSSAPATSAASMPTGAFHFSGRSKDLLRVKGINVSPVEVENVLGAHPAVEAVYVVGLPHDGLEQEVGRPDRTRGDPACAEARAARASPRAAAVALQAAGPLPAHRRATTSRSAAPPSRSAPRSRQLAAAAGSAPSVDHGYAAFVRLTSS